MFKKSKQTKFGADAEYWRPVSFGMEINTDRRAKELPNDNSDILNVTMALFVNRQAYLDGADPIETKFLRINGNDSPVKYNQIRNQLRGNLVDMDEWLGAEEVD